MAFELKKYDGIYKGDWRSFKMPWGKYKGDTMYIIYINNWWYIRDVLSCCNDPLVKSVAEKVIEHKRETDPWSYDD